jgi:beta-lactamase regulating signal transducer with metallopeptidase domain
MPAAGAILAALFFELPSFLYFEPKGLDEQLGVLPITLSAVCLVVLGWRVWQAVSVCKRTSELCRHWTDGVQEAQQKQGLPVFTTSSSAPALAVVGIRQPRLLLCPELLLKLNRAELDRALAHEAAHVRNRDNFRKMTLLLCWFPGMAALERRWADASELAADESAVSNTREALDLASALVKISVMNFAAPTPEALVANFGGSHATIARRVQLLTSWEKKDREAGGYRWMRVAVFATAATVLFVNYSFVLGTLHAFTETLFR